MVNGQTVILCLRHQKRMMHLSDQVTSRSQEGEQMNSDVVLYSDGSTVEILDDQLIAITFTQPLPEYGIDASRCESLPIRKVVMTPREAHALLDRLHTAVAEEPKR